MTIQARWTTELLAQMPQVEGERYEIIDGELYVTTQPHHRHQATSGNIHAALHAWSHATGAGRPYPAPGVIFSEDTAVAPDVVWVRAARLGDVLGDDGKLHGAPDLVVEVLSPGKVNEERDRERKLRLYDRRGVREYWIADWRARTVEVFRRQGDDLAAMTVLGEGDVLESPLLPGLSVAVAGFFTT